MPPSINRRSFFASSARSVMLLGFAAFAVCQEGKRRRLRSDPDCIKLSVCSDCIEFGRCTKPKAQSARASASMTS